MAHLRPDLSTLTASSYDAIGPGNVVTLRYVVENNAPVELDALIVRWILSPELSLRQMRRDGETLQLLGYEAPGVVGAHAGAIAPWQFVTFEADVVVAELVDDGSVATMQAVLRAGIADGPEVGSNIIELPIVSEPALDVHREAFVDGDRVGVRVRITNNGKSVAHRVVASVSCPDDYDAIAGDDTRIELRGRNLVVLIDELRAGDASEATLWFRARRESGAFDAREIIVLCEEIPAFTLSGPGSIAHGSPEFVVAIAPTKSTVRPGETVDVNVTVQNVGNAPGDVVLELSTGYGAAVIRESLAVDDVPSTWDEVHDERQSVRVRVPSIAAHDERSVSVLLAVAGDAHGKSVDVRARLVDGADTEAWIGVEGFARVEAGPAAVPIAVESQVETGSTVPLRVSLFNAGTAPTEALTLKLACPIVHSWWLAGDDGQQSPVAVVDDKATLSVPPLQPGEERVVELACSIVAVATNGSEHALDVILGDAFYASKSLSVKSRPKLLVRRADSPALRPGVETLVSYEVANEGSDAAHDLELALRLTPDCEAMPIVRTEKLEPGKTLAFSVPVTLRRWVDGNGPVRVDGALHAFYGVKDDVLQQRLRSEFLPTHAEHRVEFEFSDLFDRNDEEERPVSPGDIISFRLAIANAGDAPATDIRARALPCGLSYIAGSFQLNGEPLPDAVGAHPMHNAQTGVRIGALVPGESTELRWSAVVPVDAAAGDRIKPVVELVVDAVARQARAAAWIVAAPVRASLPLMPLLALRGGLAQLGAAPRMAALPPAPAAAPEQPKKVTVDPPVPETVLAVDVTPIPSEPEAPTTPAEEVTPATPSSELVPSAYATFHEDPFIGAVPPAAELHDDVAAAEVAHPPIDLLLQTLVSERNETARFASNRIEQMQGLLAKVQGKGLCTHVFALRTFFPDLVVAVDGDISNAYPRLDGALAVERQALKSIVDRLFLRMNLREFSLETRDVEDSASRDALTALLRELGAIDDQFRGEQRTVTHALIARVDVPAVIARLDELHAAPLGDALPYAILADLLGTETDEPLVTAPLRAYKQTMRDTLTMYAGQGADAFLRALRQPAPNDLDGKLDDVLRSFVHLGVEA